MGVKFEKRVKGNAEDFGVNYCRDSGALNGEFELGAMVFGVG